MSPANIGKPLKKIRKNRDLTQEQLDKKAGIHTNYYAHIERNEVNPSLDVFESIVKALKIKSSDILDF